MKLINHKVLCIFSDGSLSFSSKSFLNSRQLLIFDKDNRNFILNKKKNIKKLHSEFFSEYKKKFLI